MAGEAAAHVQAASSGESAKGRCGCLSAAYSLPVHLGRTPFLPMSAPAISHWFLCSLFLLIAGCEKKLTEDEIMAYNAGWHYAVRIRESDGPTREKTLSGMLDRIPSQLHDECREGFSDGLAGKKAKVVIPEKLLKD